MNFMPIKRYFSIAFFVFGAMVVLGAFVFLAIEVVLFSAHLWQEVHPVAGLAVSGAFLSLVLAGILLDCCES